MNFIEAFNQLIEDSSMSAFKEELSVLITDFSGIEEFEHFLLACHEEGGYKNLDIVRAYKSNKIESDFPTLTEFENGLDTYGYTYLESVLKTPMTKRHIETLIEKEQKNIFTRKDLYDILKEKYMLPMKRIIFELEINRKINIF